MGFIKYIIGENNDHLYINHISRNIVPRHKSENYIEQLFYSFMAMNFGGVGLREMWWGGGGGGGGGG